MNKFVKPAAYGNQFIKKFILPSQKALDYIYGHRDRTFHITEGPVRAGKTTDNRIMFCEILEESSGTLFLTMGISQGAAKTILWDGAGLGIAHYPDWQERIEMIDGRRVKHPQRIFETKYKGMDALALIPKVGSNMPVKYIVSFGARTAVDHHPYTGWDIEAWIATQWELFHPNSRKQLLKRTIASSNRKHLIDLNPISPKAEIYREFDRWEQAGQVNYVLKLMEDNPALTPERIEEIKLDYDPESVDYQRDILGKRVAGEGTIYTVRDYNILDTYNLNDYKSYAIVADVGQESSATVFTLQALTKDNKSMDVLKEYYHRNADVKEAEVKLSSDYAKDFQDFILECYKMIGRIPRIIRSDIDLNFIREFERTKYNAGLGAVHLDYKFKKDSINDRIKTGTNYLYKGRLRFYKECVKTIEAFKTAIYDPKEKDKGLYARYDAPHEGTMIDPIDSVEYGFSAFKYEMDRYRG